MNHTYAVIQFAKWQNGKTRKKKKLESGLSGLPSSEEGEASSSDLLEFSRRPSQIK